MPILLTACNFKVEIESLQEQISYERMYNTESKRVEYGRKAFKAEATMTVSVNTVNWDAIGVQHPDVDLPIGQNYKFDLKFIVNYVFNYDGTINTETGSTGTYLFDDVFRLDQGYVYYVEDTKDESEGLDSVKYFINPLAIEYTSTWDWHSSSDYYADLLDIKMTTFDSDGWMSEQTLNRTEFICNFATGLTATYTAIFKTTVKYIQYF